MSHKSQTPLHGVDPSAPGNIIRAALAFESIFTVGAGVYLLCFPRHYLLQTMDAPALQVTTTAVQITQQFGAVNVFIGTMVGFFIPNTKLAIQTRHILYYAFLGFELCFVPLMVWQALVMEGGMPRRALLAGASQFVPFVLWRIFTLGWKREWFGRYLVGGKRE